MAYISKTITENNINISPITHSRTVIMNENGENLKDFLNKNNELYELVYPKNKFITIIIDDLISCAVSQNDWFNKMKIKPDFGLRADSIDNGNVTWEEIIRLYDLGFEIAYHGTYHSSTWTDDLINTDVQNWLKLAKEHGIQTVGYVGPNGAPLPYDSEKYFLWAREARRGQGNSSFGDGVKNSDIFANLTTIWLDTITDTDSIINLTDNLTNNQYIVLSWHCQNTDGNKTQLETIINGLYSKGLIYLSPAEAVKQNMIKYGSLGNNSIFEIANNSATNNYFMVAGHGKIRPNQLTTV